MKRAKSWLFMAAAVLLLSLLATTNAALPFKKVALTKTAASTTSTTSTTTIATDITVEEDQQEQEQELSAADTTAEGGDGKSDNGTQLAKNSKLTGIPQIDYIWDPNLPRELRGYNLSSYPFHSTVPPEDEIHFKCEGLHDGFYASIEHKCQVYHHCVYGIRHDFLCANFTAFDQRTFICHFASDVDCEGSQKYWNRNDELYMATTTTSTSTTTTEPPPTPRRRPAQPQRPRRPYNRRPIDDYYYDEQEYEDDYYEERLNRRHKARPRHRKPVDYDDEYEEKRDETKPRRNSARNRYREEDELNVDYEEHRNRPRSRTSKPTTAAAGERRKAARKPGRVDERRSFNDERTRKDKLKSVPDTDAIDEASNARRVAGRRRSNEKPRIPPSTAAALDELDDYEKPYGIDQEEAAEEDAPQKVKTTPKPLEEFITPKAASSSVYSRPRAPPRIARPVPINEKKKYSYPVQKSTATTAAPVAAAAEDDDYYQQPQEDDYEQLQSRGAARRRTTASSDVEEPPVKRRNQKITRPSLRKPVTDKKPLNDDVYYDSDRFETRRKRPLLGRPRSPAADVDFVDDDYEERPAPARTATQQRLRPKAALPRKPVPRLRQPIVEQEDELEEEIVAPAVQSDSDEEAVIEQEQVPVVRNRANALSALGRRTNNKVTLGGRQRALPTARSTAAPEIEAELPTSEQQVEEEPANEDVNEPLAPAAPAKTVTSIAGRPASVRVVKRPFLPSRGGSPYLPRGLQPVGVALKPLLDTRTTDSTPIDMGSSTISGVRLLEHGAPLLRDTGSDEEFVPRVQPPSPTSASAPTPTTPRTTLPPRSALPSPSTQKRPEPQPKVNLDELYENDYDVTLNDALDPTLKPLTPQHQHQHQSYIRPYASAYAASPPLQQQQQHQHSPSSAYNPFAHNHNSNSHNYQQQAYQPQQYHQTHQQQQQSHYQQQHQQQQSHHSAAAVAQQSLSASASASASALASAAQSQPNYHSDSYFSSTDIRRRAIVPAQAAHPHRQEYSAGGAVSHVNTRLAQHYYDDFTY